MEAAHLPAHAASARPSGGRLLRLRSDEQLVARFRAGDDDAFDVIHDRYRARLLAYVRQMLGASRADAEDALQDVLMRAHTTLRADDRPVALRAWLYRVAHNRCIDQLRRPVNQQASVELPETLSARDDPARDAEAREELRRLVADIGRLPEQQRSALLMRELEGLGHADLAAALDVSVPAVKSLLVRARIGLTEARLARDTACREIQEELAGAHDRGVRPAGRARRHLRECSCCTDYRTALRGLDRGLAALGPAVGPWALAAKLLGMGGAGSAGGGAALLGGGGGAVVSTTTVTGAIGALKVAAIVTTAAAVVGGGVEGGRAVQSARHASASASAAHVVHAAPAVARSGSATHHAAVATGSPTVVAALRAAPRTPRTAAAPPRHHPKRVQARRTAAGPGTDATAAVAVAPAVLGGAVTAPADPTSTAAATAASAGSVLAPVEPSVAVAVAVTTELPAAAVKQDTGATSTGTTPTTATLPAVVVSPEDAAPEAPPATTTP